MRYAVRRRRANVGGVLNAETSVAMITAPVPNRWTITVYQQMRRRWDNSLFWERATSYEGTTAADVTRLAQEFVASKGWKIVDGQAPAVSGEDAVEPTGLVRVSYRMKRGNKRSPEVGWLLVRAPRLPGRLPVILAGDDIVGFSFSSLAKKAWGGVKSAAKKVGSAAKTVGKGAYKYSGAKFVTETAAKGVSLVAQKAYQAGKATVSLIGKAVKSPKALLMLAAKVAFWPVTLGIALAKAMTNAGVSLIRRAVKPAVKAGALRLAQKRGHAGKPTRQDWIDAGNLTIQAMKKVPATKGGPLIKLGAKVLEWKGLGIGESGMSGDCLGAIKQHKLSKAEVALLEKFFPTKPPGAVVKTTARRGIDHFGGYDGTEMGLAPLVLAGLAGAIGAAILLVIKWLIGAVIAMASGGGGGDEQEAPADQAAADQAAADGTPPPDGAPPEEAPPEELPPEDPYAADPYGGEPPADPYADDQGPPPDEEMQGDVPSKIAAGDKKVVAAAVDKALSNQVSPKAVIMTAKVVGSGMAAEGQFWDIDVYFDHPDGKAPEGLFYVARLRAVRLPSGVAAKVLVISKKPVPRPGATVGDGATTALKVATKAGETILRKGFGMPFLLIPTNVLESMRNPGGSVALGKPTGYNAKGEPTWDAG